MPRSPNVSEASDIEARRKNPSSLEPIFNARSVAVLGASSVPSKLGRVVIENMREQGYSGHLFPVNRMFSEVLGYKCYSRVAELPETPDLAVMVIPASGVSSAISECLEKGTRHFIVMSAGFKEMNDAEGISREEELSKIAKKSSARIVGPNCLGLFDNISRIDTFFLPRNLIQRPKKGKVSLASQSGSFVGHFLDLAASENLGIARAITYGNRVDVDEADALDFYFDDPETEIVGLYIEGIEGGKNFLKSLEKCAKKKPIIVLKTGKYESMSRAISSHTGAIAGRYASYVAAFKKACAVEVHSLEEFVDICKAFSCLPKSKGDRVLIVGHAGGLGLTIADHCISMGLGVPELPPDLRQNVRAITLPYASLANPVDLTASGTDDQVEKVLDLCLNEDFADIAIYLALWGLPQSSARIGSIVAWSIKKYGKPIVIASLQGRACRENRHVFEDLGVPVFPSLQRAACVAKHLAVKRNFNAPSGIQASQQT